MQYILPVFGVEDDKEDSESIIEAFKHEGIHDYFFFPEPGEFFAVFSENVPVIVIDYNLPLMNGQEVLDKAKRINKSVKAILISGVITPEMSARLILSGAVDFVVKSVRGWQRELAAKVKKQLNIAADEIAELKQKTDYSQQKYDKIQSLLKR